MSVVNLNTFALTVYVVSSSSSPSPISPSPPATPGDIVLASSPSSCPPSVAGVSARDVDDGASRFVDAGVDAVVAPEVAGGGAKLKPKPKPEPKLGAAAAGWDEARDGEPKEKPTLPALGEGVVPSTRVPAATPNTNCEGVAADVAEPKAPLKGEDDDDDDDGGLAGEPNVVAPNTLLGGDVLLSFSFSLLSLSFSVDLGPNILPELEELLVVPVSPKSFVPGGMLNVNGEAPNVEAGLSLSFSFPSVVDDLLSDPPKSVDDFGGLPNIEDGWLLPKGEVLEVVPADADGPNKNVGFEAGSASFGVEYTGGLKAEDDDEDEGAVNEPNGDVEVTGASLVSEGAVDADGKVKGEEPVTDAAGLGVKPVPSVGAAELAVAGGAGKPGKLEVEVLGLPNENDAAGVTGLLAALSALRVVG